MIGIVVPAYNRKANLELLLMSLERQSSTDFHVVVADDGSTDDTAALVAEMACRPVWRDRLARVNCGPHQGVRTGRARNIGAANLVLGTRLLLMIDTDLVLQPDALAMFAAAHARHPGRVLFGAVDWLPPMDWDEVSEYVSARRIEALRRRVPAPPSSRIEGTFVGPELRIDLFKLPAGRPSPDRAAVVASAELRVAAGLVLGDRRIRRDDDGLRVPGHGTGCPCGRERGHLCAVPGVVGTARLAS